MTLFIKIWNSYNPQAPNHINRQSHVLWSTVASAGVRCSLKFPRNPHNHPEKLTKKILTTNNKCWMTAQLGDCLRTPRILLCVASMTLNLGSAGFRELFLPDDYMNPRNDCFWQSLVVKLRLNFQFKVMTRKLKQLVLSLVSYSTVLGINNSGENLQSCGYALYNPSKVWRLLSLGTLSPLIFASTLATMKIFFVLFWAKEQHSDAEWTATSRTSTRRDMEYYLIFGYLRWVGVMITTWFTLC